MKPRSFEEYATEEKESVLNGEKLLAPEQVMERLTITRRQLQELHRGELLRCTPVVGVRGFRLHV